MSLYSQDVRVTSVMLTNPRKAKAIENDVRAKILDMLADQEMTIGEIHDELRRRDEDKAETTVRHHVDVLKDAGLVELTRLEDARGGTLKYYRSNTRLLSYEVPDDAESTLADIADEVGDDVQDLIETITRAYGDDLRAIAEEMKPCGHCSTQRYEEYLLRELLNRSFTGLSEEHKLDSLT